MPWMDKDLPHIPAKQKIEFPTAGKERMDPHTADTRRPIRNPDGSVQVEKDIGHPGQRDL